MSAELLRRAAQEARNLSDATHLIAWQPDVAHAIANWLDEMLGDAATEQVGRVGIREYCSAMTVARALLEEAS